MKKSKFSEEQIVGLSTHMHQTGNRAMESLDAVDKRVKHIERLLDVKPLT